MYVYSKDLNPHCQSLTCRDPNLDRLVAALDAVHGWLDEVYEAQRGNKAKKGEETYYFIRNQRGESAAQRAKVVRRLLEGWVGQLAHQCGPDWSAVKCRGQRPPRCDSKRRCEKPSLPIPSCGIGTLDLSLPAAPEAAPSRGEGHDWHWGFRAEAATRCALIMFGGGLKHPQVLMVEGPPDRVHAAMRSVQTFLEGFDASVGKAFTRSDGHPFAYYFIHSQRGESAELRRLGILGCLKYGCDVNARRAASSVDRSTPFEPERAGPADREPSSPRVR